MNNLTHDILELETRIKTKYHKVYIPKVYIPIKWLSNIIHVHLIK